MKDGKQKMQVTSCNDWGSNPSQYKDNGHCRQTNKTGVLDRQRCIRKHFSSNQRRQKKSRTPPLSAIHSAFFGPPTAPLTNSATGTSLPKWRHSWPDLTYANIPPPHAYPPAALRLGSPLYLADSFLPILHRSHRPSGDADLAVFALLTLHL